MSDQELSSDHTAINLKQVGAGAEHELLKFAGDLIHAVSKSDASEANKKAVTTALSKALDEVNPKSKQAHSSEANGAASVHRDDKKINDLQSVRNAQVVGNVAAVAAVVTGNPTLKEMAGELTADEMKKKRIGNFAELKNAADACGIKNVGTPPIKLDKALHKAYNNVETIAAIHSLRKNGFNGDTIYAKNTDLGRGPDGKADIKGFVIESAQRLEKSNQTGKSLEADGKPDFRVRPQPVTQQIQEVAKITGDKVGLSITPQQAKAFNAARAELEILGGSSNKILQAFDQNPQSDESLESEQAADSTPHPRQAGRRKKQSFGAAPIQGMVPVMTPNGFIPH